MIQLVKGEKHEHGWSKASAKEKIVIPSEEKEKYNLMVCDKVILLPGSRAFRRIRIDNKKGF